jgi:adenylate kinase family enzyme
MKIIILGPTCSGKTTLIYEALKNKIPSFTTHFIGSVIPISEKLTNHFSQFAEVVLNLDISLFFDAGGLSVDHSGNVIDRFMEQEDIKKVLLLPSNKVYRKRLDREISINPNREKYILKWEHTYDEFKKQKPLFDLVIEDDISPQEMLDCIIKIFGFKK